MTPRHVSRITRHPQAGVALIITLIMLAVITFMAVTFLALSRREAGAVRVSTDAITAANAAYTGVERVKVNLMAPILTTKNIHNFEQMVSTNYLLWPGYDIAAGANPTNVNFQYPNGSPLTGNDVLQCLANSLYDPRPPVFVTNRLFPNSNEFRFYLDLNRNGRYDTNGYWPVISADPANPFYDTNGITYPVPPPGITASNHFVGDPEWIGVLARPEFPHSATNQYVARYAFIVVPTGKTLDLNYAHNQAKHRPFNQDGFLRNQGIASWEINLAGFLADLNTNLWLVPPPQGYAMSLTPPYYRYSPAVGSSSVGAAFEDAYWLVRYRYATRWDTLLPVTTLFGAAGDAAFSQDLVDGYTHGPVMTNYWGWTALPPDPDAPLTTRAWPGSDNPQHFFTTQDLFDNVKLPPRIGFDFVDRLKIAGTNASSYDRYTFYRLHSQLGTDSAPEPPDKINLNYDNLVRRNAGGVVSATNFYDWDATTLFTNVAHKLLVEYSREWLNANSNIYFASYGTSLPFGVTNIPVWVNSNFVYTPSLHRLLQLAANICDASTNRTSASRRNANADFPSVFRPVFGKQGTNVYITGYTSVERVLGASDPVFSIPLDLKRPADVTALQPNDNVYGVPWVIGAKKGFPNFNEFAMQAVVQVSRKLQVTRPNDTPSQNDPSWQTNMLYVVGISNVVSLEAWNSYRTNYNRDVELYVRDDLSMTLTNDLGYARTTNVSLPRLLSIPAQQWRGYPSSVPTNNFRVPLRTNVIFQYDAAYNFSSRQFTTNWDAAWDKRRPPLFELPQWRWSVANKLRFIMLDPSGRVIDYVQLDGPNTECDISAEIQKPLEGKPPAFAELWGTNRLASGLPLGINNQLQISLGDPSAGNPGAAGEDWSDYGKGNPTGPNKEFAIDYYRAMYGLSPLFGNRWPNGLRNTNLVQQVPFSPTARVVQYVTWQANDPLVHYTPGDLQYLALTNGVERPSAKEDLDTIRNIGFLNDRYEPWGGKTGGGQNTRTDPNAFNAAVKDPLVRSSDDWSFLTNRFPNVGWLGRVHRGTPWQTVYMKSLDVTAVPNGVNAWQNWSGNGSFFSLNATNVVLDATRSAPATDRWLFDFFTTAFNENATRGQLSVNQSGLAAWSAVFTGVHVLSNNASDSVLNVLRLQPYRPLTNFGAFPIEPVGLNGTNSPLWKIVDGINRERNRIIGTNGAGAPIYAYPGQSFRHAGDILAVPELSTNSPFLNRSSLVQAQNGINDAVVEWLPQQVMSLLRAGEPRFVVYSYGQTLRPARNSLYMGAGPFNGMCTNYQVTAEVATRTVLKVEGSPDPKDSNPALPAARRYPPRIVVESFNLLPPD